MSNLQDLRKAFREKVKIGDLVELNKKGYTNCLLHSDSTPSAVVLSDSRGEILYCHSCKKRMDSLEIYKILHQCSETQALKEGLNNASVSHLQNIPHVQNKIATSNKEHTQEQYQERLKTFIPYAELSGDDKKRIHAYFYYRALDSRKCIEILESNGVEVGMVVVGDNFKQTCFKTDKMLIVIKFDKKKQKNKKMNYGSNHYFKLRVNDSKTWLITEGLEDALTGCLLGFNVVCLNGCGNAKNLVESIVEHRNGMLDTNFILALDNDDTGIYYNKYLKHELLKFGFKTGALANIYQVKGADLNQLHQEGKIRENNIIVKSFN